MQGIGIGYGTGSAASDAETSWGVEPIPPSFLMTPCAGPCGPFFEGGAGLRGTLTGPKAKLPAAGRLPQDTKSILSPLIRSPPLDRSDGVQLRTLQKTPLWISFCAWAILT